MVGLLVLVPAWSNSPVFRKCKVDYFISAHLYSNGPKRSFALSVQHYVLAKYYAQRTNLSPLWIPPLHTPSLLAIQSSHLLLDNAQPVKTFAIKVNSENLFFVGVVVAGVVVVVDDDDDVDADDDDWKLVLNSQLVSGPLLSVRATCRIALLASLCNFFSKTKETRFGKRRWNKYVGYATTPKPDEALSRLEGGEVVVVAPLSFIKIAQ